MGPLRFNLSKSGIGLSAGVRGLRLGTGPRGNYIHMGRGGLYYRRTLSSRPGRRSARAGSAVSTSTPVPLPGQGIVLRDIAGAPFEQLTVAEPSDLVADLTSAARYVPVAPFVVAVAVGFALVGGGVGLLAGAVMAPLAVWLAVRDRSKRTVAAVYDINDGVAQRFESVVAATRELTTCHRIWFVSAAGDLQSQQQRKRNSGASAVIARRSATVSLQGPKHLTTNIAVPTLSGGRSSIHLLPDRILLREGRRYADLTYDQLRVTARAQRFIEDGPVPRDARQVGSTWRFVNRDGSPDRRFNGNRQLPIMLYGRLTMTSASGFQHVFDASRLEPVQGLAQAISQTAIQT